MRNKGMFVQRIESGETGKGIPDLFVITKGVPMWIELKRIHDTCSNKSAVNIPWRPGQQAWLFDVRARGVATTTLACFNDGILRIPHATIWLHDRVPVELCNYYKDIKELLR